MTVLFVDNVKAVFAVLTAIVVYVPSQSNCAALTTKEFARELEKLARKTNLDNREVYRTKNLEDHSESGSYGGDKPCMEWNPYDSGTRMVVVFMPKLRLCGCPVDMYEDVHEKSSKTEETCEARENESMNYRQSTTPYDIEREMFDDTEHFDQERYTYPSKIYKIYKFP